MTGKCPDVELCYVFFLPDYFKSEHCKHWTHATSTGWYLWPFLSCEWPTSLVTEDSHQLTHNQIVSWKTCINYKLRVHLSVLPSLSQNCNATSPLYFLCSKVINRYLELHTPSKKLTLKQREEFFCSSAKTEVSFVGNFPGFTHKTRMTAAVTGLYQFCFFVQLFLQIRQSLLHYSQTRIKCLRPIPSIPGLQGQIFFAETLIKILIPTKYIIDKNCYDQLFINKNVQIFTFQFDERVIKFYVVKVLLILTKFSKVVAKLLEMFLVGTRKKNYFK